MTKRSSIAIGLFVVLVATACNEPPNVKPTPEAYKRFLKLRGYEFDEKTFFKAVAANDVSAVDGFIGAGINVNARAEDTGATPLIYAAGHDGAEIVKVLLKNGAEVNAKDNAGYTAILRAIQSKNDEIADLLLQQPGIDLNAQGKAGSTVLISYVWRGRDDVVKRVLDGGADPNLTDGDGDTALHGAAQRGSLELTKMLLDAHADPNAKNKLGGTALMWAGVYGHTEVARLLIDRGAKAGVKDNDGMTAAAWAAKNKHDDLAKILHDAERR